VKVAAATFVNSIIQFLRRFSQLPLSPLCVPGGRVQILVTENLSEANKVILIVREKLMRHRVAEQMRMQVDADQSRILVAQGPHAAIGQRTSLADKQLLQMKRWSNLKVCLNRLSSREWQRDAPLFSALPTAENSVAAPLAEHQVGDFEFDKVAHPAPGVEQQTEDRRRPDVLPQLDFSKQSPNRSAIQTLRSQWLATEFLHGLGCVHLDSTFSNQPVKQPPDRHEAAVHRRHALALISMQVVSKIGYVSDSDPTKSECLSVRLNEPFGKLAEIVANRPSRVD
jgi:hypothetical protein